WRGGYGGGGGKRAQRWRGSGRVGGRARSAVTSNSAQFSAVQLLALNTIFSSSFSVTALRKLPIAASSAAAHTCPLTLDSNVLITFKVRSTTVELTLKLIGSFLSVKSF